jgi:DNA-binding transcriptional ArsR family regulator
MDSYKQLALMMKALGHPTRLRILDILRREGEACVCHMEHLLGLRQAYISQQLASLREAGLVVDRRDKLNVFYSMADDSIDHLMDVALEMVRASVGSKVHTSIIDLPENDKSSSCPCPKCQKKSAIEKDS